MKKLLILILFIGLPLILTAQLSGLGTLASPYSGTFEGDLQWNITNFPDGKVFIGGDVTIDNELLTIGPGMKIIFVAEGADLIITTTGQLNANGSSGSMILFTADDNDNGVTGETGERWGHLVFRSSAGAASINYAIIEFGDVITGSNTTSYGGGIYSEISGLTVSNTIIRNNASTHGGGIGAGGSPAITNCLISNNNATSSGGGIYLLSSSSLLTNCIISNNTTGAGGGGGIFLDACSNVRVINSTIASNSSTELSRGQNIQYYNISDPTNRPSFINCIAWGNDNSITHVSSSQQSSDFVNCAIQDISTPASSYTACIDLSGTNGDATGPNFTATDGSNWAIKFISPCRDAGTASGGAPSNDYLGKSRIGNHDIGAYEVQYSRWIGNGTGWITKTNWQAGLNPSGASDIIIPSGTPFYPDDYASPPDVTIGSNNYLFIEPGARVTFNTLVNNGSVNLSSNSSSIFSMLIKNNSGYSGPGTANIDMYLTGDGAPNWKWHYVAVPADWDKSIFTSINALNLMRYDDSSIPNDLTHTDNDGWVFHDGYKIGDPPAGPFTGTPFTTLYIGFGYGFYHINSSVVVNFNNISALQSSLGTLSLQYSGSGKLVPSNYGYNLLGNSLTCGIDWNSVTETGDINNAVYYTIDYKIGTYLRNIGGINGATNHIPPLQGFLVKANESGTSLDFSGAKEHTSQQRYKGTNGSTTVDPLIKLELNNSGNQDETLIAFNDKATTSFDSDYDAAKLFSTGYDQIYTWFGSDKYAINSIPLPSVSIIIPVAVKLLNSGSNFKIIASQLQLLGNYNVTLTDKGNSNFVTDLKKTNSYTFSSDAGTFTDRFILTISLITTGVSDINISTKDFNVFAFDKTLNIDMLKTEWEGKTSTVSIYNLTGRMMLQMNSVELYKGALKKIPLNIPQGVYIVEIKAKNQKFVTKINLIR